MEASLDQSGAFTSAGGLLKRACENNPYAERPYTLLLLDSLKINCLNVYSFSFSFRTSNNPCCARVDNMVEAVGVDAINKILSVLYF